MPSLSAGAQLTALLATQGFRDAIEIRRENRYELYDLMLEMPQPLVPRYLRFDVPQRTLADGTTLQELDVAFVERLTRELVANGIEAVAIVFLHSFTNPAAEREARAIIQRVAPQMRVAISSEVVPEIREFERTSTTIANVYVQDRVERYLRELQARMTRAGFSGNLFLMISSGGIVTVETAIRFPVRLLESGPAAGALAAASYGSACGYPDLLSFDMGGTTAKFCVIDQGQPLTTHEFEVDRRYRLKKGSGQPIKLPVIEMIEIGAGGGSIARIDPLGLLKVGPESAGAEPGPACYGLGGTEPTVTDADLVLGYLDPDYFLGGQLKIDLAAARRAIEERVAAPLGLSVEEAAWGIHQIVNESMANAARIHTLERGKDPHSFPVFAFGGAGPVHGFRIAKALGSPALIAPFGAGVMSAFGFLTAPLAFDFVRSWRGRLECPRLAEGQCPARTKWRRRVRRCWSNQVSRRSKFATSGRRIFATWVRVTRYRFPCRPVNWAARALPPCSQRLKRSIAASTSDSARRCQSRSLTGASLRPALPRRYACRRGMSRERVKALSRDKRQAYFPEWGGYAATPVYNRYALLPGASLSGPAIVEERESTVIIGPDCRFHIDEQRNLIVEL